MEPDTPSTPTLRTPFGLVAILVGTLAAAGSAAGVVFDATRGKFDAKLPDVPAASEKLILEGIALQKAGARKSSAFSGGCAGAIIVGAFGFVMGGATRSAVRAVGGLFLGALFGGGLGAAAGYATQEVTEYAISHGINSTTSYYLISFAFWAVLGLAATITVALVGPRRIPLWSRIGSPMTGAVLASLLTPVFASVAFPLDYKGRIPPLERNEALLVGTVGATLLALGAGVTLRDSVFSSRA